MANIVDMTGKKIGLLTFLEPAKGSRPGAQWWVQCDCGQKTIVSGWQVRQGMVKSCGCLRRAINAEKAAKSRKLTFSCRYEIKRRQR